MSKSTRIFELVHMLGGRRPRTVAEIAEKLDAATALAEETPRALRLASIDRSGPKAEEALEPLRLAISRSETVEIRYDSLSGGQHKWRHVDPWQVFEREGAWYLVGRCHVHNESRMFRLDRISGTKGSGATFEIPPEFSLDEFLEGSWRIFSGDGHYKVHLRFDKSLAPLILNARHHPGEEVTKRKDGSVDYKVELSSLEEIARWVVGFGGKCRVVGPGELNRQIVTLAGQVLRPADS